MQVFKFALVAALTLTSIPALAAQFREMKLESVRDVSVVVVAKGCTTKKKVLGIPVKKKVDCYGILVKDAVGTDSLRNTLKPGNLFFFPAAAERGEANRMAETILAAMSGKAQAGTSVTLSNVRFLDKAVALSAQTSDPADTDQIRFAGIGISSYTQRSSGHMTYAERERIQIGIQ